MWVTDRGAASLNRVVAPAAFAPLVLAVVGMLVVAVSVAVHTWEMEGAGARVLGVLPVPE